jgi:hypothetical protein
MMMISFAIDRKGIAAVTARAASGVDFHAMTTVSGSADIGAKGGISKRPEANNPASESPSCRGGQGWF